MWFTAAAACFIDAITSQFIVFSETAFTCALVCSVSFKHLYIKVSSSDGDAADFFKNVLLTFMQSPQAWWHHLL